MKKSTKMFLGLIVSAILIGLDQLTKYLAVVHLKEQEPVRMLGDIFELFYLENHGAAFGMMQQKQIFFYILTVLFCALILYYYAVCPKGKRYLPLNILFVTIFSGAIGNFIDRVRMQYVVDFLYFKLINFPVFNVADIYVTCSVFVFIALMLFFYKEEELEFLWPKGRKDKKQHE